MACLFLVLLTWNWTATYVIANTVMTIKPADWNKFKVLQGRFAPKRTYQHKFQANLQVKFPSLVLIFFILVLFLMLTNNQWDQSFAIDWFNIWLFWFHSVLNNYNGFWFFYYQMPQLSNDPAVTLEYLGLYWDHTLTIRTIGLEIDIG